MTASRGASALACIALAISVGGGVASAQSGPPNYSSHNAAFFEELLAGRVWLYERPNAAEAADRGLVWGVHHAADGTAMACFRLDGAWQARTGRWRVVSSPRFRALYNYRKAGTEPDPGHVKGHVPLFYDPETGRLHSESLGGGAGRQSDWFVLSLGWVQESWPRALKRACPGLDLPAGLAINGRQTSAVMEEAVAQDPEAALRTVAGSSPVPGRSPVAGSELRAPGSTGLAMSAGAPTVTAAELARFLAANDGYVLESPAGVRLVLALGAERDELWRLDRDGNVTDTAVLLPSAEGSPAGIAVQWERLPRRQDYRIGDPFPLRPTGERYGAFLLTDRLVAAGRPAALPFGEQGDVSGRSPAALRFLGGGRVTAQAAGGAATGGRWRWSRGHLHVALDGGGTVAWPWRDLARHLGAAVAPGAAGAGE